MNISEAVIQEMSLLEGQRDRIMNHPKIAPFIKSIDTWMQSNHGRPATLYEKRNVAQCCYNAMIDAGLRKGGRRLMEATTEDYIDMLGIQLPVISALLPSLVLNDVAIVQAIERRFASVFYMDVKYGTSKGTVTSGDTMVSATTGHNTSKTGRRYAMARVEREKIGDGDGAHTGTTSTAPGLINLANVVVESYDGVTYTVIGTSDASGNITGAGISGTGTITAAGVYNITPTGQGSTDDILLTYDYQYDLPVDAYGNRDGVPEINIEITQSAVEAMDFPLRAKWSLGAAIDAQKSHKMLCLRTVTYVAKAA